MPAYVRALLAALAVALLSLLGTTGVASATSYDCPEGFAYGDFQRQIPGVEQFCYMPTPGGPEGTDKLYVIKASPQYVDDVTLPGSTGSASNPNPLYVKWNSMEWLDYMGQFGSPNAAINGTFFKCYDTCAFETYMKWPTWNMRHQSPFSTPVLEAVGDPPSTEGDGANHKVCLNWQGGPGTSNYVYTQPWTYQGSDWNTVKSLGEQYCAGVIAYDPNYNYITGFPETKDAHTYVGFDPHPDNLMCFAVGGWMLRFQVRAALQAMGCTPLAQLGSGRASQFTFVDPYYGTPALVQKVIGYPIPNHQVPEAVREPHFFIIDGPEGS